MVHSKSPRRHAACPLDPRRHCAAHPCRQCPCAAVLRSGGRCACQVSDCEVTPGGDPATSSPGWLAELALRGMVLAWSGAWAWQAWGRWAWARWCAISCPPLTSVDFIAQSRQAQDWQTPLALALLPLVAWAVATQVRRSMRAAAAR